MTTIGRLQPFRVRPFAVAALACALGLGGVAADAVEFRKIVDTQTPIPGGSGTFDGFGFRPAISGRSIAFRGFGAGQNGIYRWDDGVLTVVADLGDDVPDLQAGPVKFRSFGEPSIDGGTVAFQGIADLPFFGDGIYAHSDAGLRAVANFDTSVPGTGSAFLGLGSPVVLGDRVVFTGSGSDALTGVYEGSAGGGAVRAIADRFKPVPGGIGNFMDVAAPAGQASLVAFWGEDAAMPRGDRGI